VARFDESRVARAIHNLARNAMEAMGDAGGRLTIAAGLEGDELWIRVSDTGPGVPEAVRDRLFLSFVTAASRVEPAWTGDREKDRGRARGTVRVDSSPQGATFELRLPQRRADDAGSSDRPNVPRASRTGQSARWLSRARADAGRSPTECCSLIPSSCWAWPGGRMECDRAA